MGESIMPFDWTLYGAKCRKKRLDMGYASTKAFAESVQRRTRMPITKDILYKIEQGRQVPEALTFACLNMSLWGHPFPRQVVDECSSPEFRSLFTAYIDHMNPDTWEGSPYCEEMPYVPRRWAAENTEAACELDEVKQMEAMLDAASGEERHIHSAKDTSIALKEPVTLFADIPAIPPMPEQGNR